MDKLNSIYDTLVNVSNAIVSVINVDITIVDKDLKRMYGTGKYSKYIGQSIDKSCIFAYALNYGDSFIIENPGNHKACNQCNKKDSCGEVAQVCCPIKIDNKIIGIIGLIAFNEEQKNIILKNKTNLLDFLNNMAFLIASKLEEVKKTEEIHLMAKELELIINSIDIGVISTDNCGNILRCNSIAKDMFKLDNNADNNINITKIIDNLLLDDLKDTKKIKNNKEFAYSIGSLKYRGIYNVKAITVDSDIIGYIFSFNKIKSIIKVVNDITGNTKITTFEDIIGDSKEIEMVKNHSKKIAKGSSTVLIQGESGTGKELFARAIHFESDRKNGPFISINCAAIPENLIESELFGYDSGAFTGAKKGGKIGKFELAHKGTIFLDEIGDMPIHMQTKLLRVLQENVVTRVGGNSFIPIDVRVIAASNKILEYKVEDGEFREDLFYRLNVIPIYLPPLRDRTKDISLLSNKFLYKFNCKLNRYIEGFDDSVISLFENYNWPGNVRELENVVEYSVNMSLSNIITLDDLPKRFKDDNKVVLEESKEVIPIKELEKREITKALDIYGTTKEGIEKASLELGISRATIYRKIKSYNINLS